MSIRKAVYDLLNDTETDVYPIIAPQGLTVPYGTFFVRMEYVRSQDGISVTDTTVTVNIYANDLSDCIVLSESLRAAIENASGSYDTETLSVGLLLSESDDYIEDLNKYVITQDFLLRF